MIIIFSIKISDFYLKKKEENCCYFFFTFPTNAITQDENGINGYRIRKIGVYERFYSIFDLNFGFLLFLWFSSWERNQLRKKWGVFFKCDIVFYSPIFKYTGFLMNSSYQDNLFSELVNDRMKNGIVANNIISAKT